jgi:hypothetical protein
MEKRTLTFSGRLQAAGAPATAERKSHYGQMMFD